MPKDPTNDPLWNTSPAMAIANTLREAGLMDEGFEPGVPGPDDANEGFGVASSSHVIKRNTKHRPGSFAEQLLHIAEDCPGGPPNLYDDPRPLIDVIHEQTFKNPAGLSDIKDMHAFRQLLRKARCFTLDAETSGLVAELSIAVAADLNAARQLSIPPYPVTWIEIDNHARLKRIKERGLALTPTAAGTTELGEAVRRAGWLIYPAGGVLDDCYYASYFTVVTQGAVMAPLAWLWLIGDGPEMPPIPPGAEERVKAGERLMTRLAFGIDPDMSNVATGDFSVSYAPIHKRFDATTYRPEDYDMMDELSGELRHIFALLATMSAGHAGLTVKTEPQAKHPGPSPIQPNGKPLFPLEHHHLHLHLGKRQTVDKVMRQIITHHKKRLHDVRGHFRKLRSGRMVPVKPHSRGDKALGVITKDYIVER